MSLSIRTRLTLWYTLVLSLTLAAAAAAFYFAQWRLRLNALDAELGRIKAIVVGKISMDLAEEPLGEASYDALEDVRASGLPIAVWDAEGQPLAGRWDLPTPTPPANGSTTVASSAGAFRVAAERQARESDSFSVAVAAPLAPLQRELALLRRALASGAVLALVLAAAGGWWIARGALTPVGAMARQAGAISDRTPGVRLAAPHPDDELGRLAHAFNGLLARLEDALQAQRRFMADASHELRTPVSIARTAAEVALAVPERSPAEYRDALDLVGQQARRLARMVEDMFLLARADATGLRLQPGPLYLDEVVAACARDARVLAADRGIAVEGPDDGGELAFAGDERLLRQLLMNLLDNAIRHTPAQGRVRVETGVAPDAYEIQVVDSGPGVPAADHERIFERFVRLDASGPLAEGAGLGLPIARAIAEAHGGTLRLARSDTAGSVFVLRLPRA